MKLLAIYLWNNAFAAVSRGWVILCGKTRRFKNIN